MTYKVNIMNLWDYYRHFARMFGLKTLLFKLTDSYYPYWFALGYCWNGEISVAKILNWEQRYWHEVGHYVGLYHTMQVGHIMHPWGVLRGNIGVDEVKKKLEKKGELERFESFVR